MMNWHKEFAIIAIAIDPNVTSICARKAWLELAEYWEMSKDGAYKKAKRLGYVPNRNRLAMPTAPPPFPTDHLPGTVEKIQVMRWRVENGYYWNHDEDARA